MAICRACKRSSNQTICPYCGYQAIIPTKLDKEIDSKLNSLAREYLGGKLQSLRVYVKAYAYEQCEDGLEFKEERILPLFETSEFSAGEVWDKYLFGVSEDLDITVFLNLNGTEHKFDLKLQVPKKSDEWHIGISLSEDLYVRVKVGDKKNCSVSEPIDLLDMLGK